MLVILHFTSYLPLEGNKLKSNIQENSDDAKSAKKIQINCSELLEGQYFCSDADIDQNTQQAKGCNRSGVVIVPCYPVTGITCNGITHTGSTIGFYQDMPCKWTNGYRFDVALLLSVFFGWLGIDRFYLGYPALGLMKLCSFGFFFVGHLLDIILIAIQIVMPSDGSHYIIDYYGAGVYHIRPDNKTYLRPLY